MYSLNTRDLKENPTSTFVVIYRLEYLHQNIPEPYTTVREGLAATREGVVLMKRHTRAQMTAAYPVHVDPKL